MLVAVALSSVVMGAGALALQSISANAKRATSLVEIDIGANESQNFYNSASGLIRTYIAPNFGELLFAQEMRDRMINDVNSSSAVFCLPRAGRNNIRPNTLVLSQRPTLDSPEAFRDFLAVQFPTAAAIYDANFRTEPSADSPNLTIYMLGQALSSSNINVNAIYEIDFVTPSNYNGSYVSVRRYVGNDLTNFYDIVYRRGPEDTNEFPINPVFVTFEQQSRLAAAETADLQQFQIARKSPFYLLSLPDPTINPYDKPAVTPAVTPAYKNKEGITSFSVAIPMFPSL